MDEDKLFKLLNKVYIAKGEIQRIIMWLSRLHNDLEDCEKGLIEERDNKLNEQRKIGK